MPSPQRKRVKHFNFAGHAHELTFSCYRRMPLLTNDTWRRMLSIAIRRAVERHRYRLVAFVFMPEHVHLLVLPDEDASAISALLAGIKRPLSYRIKQQLDHSSSELRKRLTVEQKSGDTEFRFWQQGPGYDRNITEAGNVQTVIDYIHQNPVRRGLCKRAIDWRWSSARQYYDENGSTDRHLPRITSLPAEFFDGGHLP